MSTDYDKNLDDVTGEIAEIYLCEDEDVPLLCFKDKTSPANMTPANDQGGL